MLEIKTSELHMACYWATASLRYLSIWSWLLEMKFNNQRRPKFCDVEWSYLVTDLMDSMTLSIWCKRQIETINQSQGRQWIASFKKQTKYRQQYNQNLLFWELGQHAINSICWLAITQSESYKLLWRIHAQSFVT